MIQALLSIAAHAVALLLYPGLLTMVAFGAIVELAWTRLSRRDWEWPELPRRRPSPVVATTAVCSVVAAAQLAAPLSPVPGDERSVVFAAIALAFTAWAELALTVEFVAAPGLLLIVQVCWLLAVLGPAVQPESLRPQVLGNLLVPGLLPVKIACAFLYLLCLPALIRLWPVTPAADKRQRQRLHAGRILTWLPYCGLFTTLFVPPSPDDVLGVLRFFGITFAVAALLIGFGLLVRRRGAEAARGLYTRAIPPFAVLVLVVVVATSILVR
ncbi:MAG TPA: hypothetical protein VJR46_01085 [Candidatus Dormibacteraeota bacterium]|nr:hypothetical protein [Candidatus Dormibacteraeota bacterium]